MSTSNRFRKSIEIAAENTAGTKAKKESATTSIAEPRGIYEILANSGKKSRGASHTLYLSADVGEALVKYSRQLQTSKSTIVDEILRKALFER